MAILLGLITAISFGSGDFFGGLATKRTSVLNVVAFSHFVGLISVIVITPFIADAFSFRDLGIGALAGIFGGIGVVGLYRGLATGPMAVVAPLTAVASAAFPALFGILSGDSLTLIAWIGILIALVAIALSSLPNNVNASGITVRTIVESLGAGIGFGALFILFDVTADDVAPWPVVGARAITSTALLLFVFFVRRIDVQEIRSSAGLIVLTGLFDTGSNVIFIIATTLGDLTIVAVLSSLYPISTVVLARAVLDERMSRVQLSGLALALIATVLIAVG